MAGFLVFSGVNKRLQGAYAISRLSPDLADRPWSGRLIDVLFCFKSLAVSGQKGCYIYVFLISLVLHSVT